MSNGHPEHAPPMTSADRLRQIGLRTLGASRTWTIEHRLSRLLGVSTAPFRAVTRPIFVWGPGRTGSYLLYDILSMHPDLVCPRNERRESKGLYGSQHYGGGEYDHLLANPFPPIEGYKRIIGRPNGHIEDRRAWTAQDARQIRRRFAQTVAGGGFGKRLLDKAPWYTYLTDLLDTMFPDGQHIRCLRHPVATAASYYRRMCEPDALNKNGCWGWRPDGWEQFIDRSLEDKATWLAICAIRQAEANAQRLQDRCTTVQYEAIVADPHGEIERVSAFLGLSPASWRGRLEGIPQAFPNYNRPTTVPSKDPDLVAEVRQLCDALGYAADQAC